MEEFIKYLEEGNIDLFFEQIKNSDINVYNLDTIMEHVLKDKHKLEKMLPEKRVEEVMNTFIYVNAKNAVLFPIEYLTIKQVSSFIFISNNRIIDMHYSLPSDFIAKILLEFYPKVLVNSNYADLVNKQQWLDKVYISEKYLKYIPSKYMDESEYYNIVKKFPDAIKDVPLEYKTKQMCLISYNYNYKNIAYIPQEYITDEMYLKAIKDNYELIKYVPKERRTQETYDEIAISHPEYIPKIPNQFISKTIIDMATKNGIVTNVIEDINETNAFFEGYLNLTYDEAKNYFASKKITKKIFNIMIDILKKYNYDLYIKYHLKKEEFYVNIIKDYVFGKYSGKIALFQEKNIDEEDFDNAVNFIKHNVKELYELYLQRAKTNSNNYQNAIDDTIKFVESSIRTSDEEKKLNVVRYFLKTNVNPMVVYKSLTNNMEKRAFYKRVLSDDINHDQIGSIRIFLKTKYIYHDELISDDLKQKVVDFVCRNDIPVNIVTLNQTLYMYNKGFLDLDKNYDKDITYEIDEIIVEDIEQKIKTIEEQVKLISSIDSLEERIKKEGKKQYGTSKNNK